MISMCIIIQNSVFRVAWLDELQIKPTRSGLKKGHCQWAVLILRQLSIRIHIYIINILWEYRYCLISFVRQWWRVVAWFHHFPRIVWRENYLKVEKVQPLGQSSASRYSPAHRIGLWGLPTSTADWRQTRHSCATCTTSSACFLPPSERCWCLHRRFVCGPDRGILSHPSRSSSRWWSQWWGLGSHHGKTSHAGGLLAPHLRAAPGTTCDCTSRLGADLSKELHCNPSLHSFLDA